MIIRIKKNDKETDEWAIVELQGDLESRSGRSFQDQFIGDVHFTKSGTPIFIIGHHILFGREVSLDKPFAVLEKKQTQQDLSLNDSIGDISPEIQYLVKAIIRKKLVFRSRPKPIISNMPKIV